MPRYLEVKVDPDTVALNLQNLRFKGISTPRKYIIRIGLPSERIESPR